MEGEIENKYLFSKGLDCLKRDEIKNNPKKIYLIISNSEIFNGIVEDSLTPMIRESLKDYNGEIIWTSLLPYDNNLIDFEISNAVDKNAEVIIVTKGLDIDGSDIVSLSRHVS